MEKLFFEFPVEDPKAEFILETLEGHQDALYLSHIDSSGTKRSVLVGDSAVDLKPFINRDTKIGVVGQIKQRNSTFYIDIDRVMNPKD